MTKINIRFEKSISKIIKFIFGIILQLWVCVKKFFIQFRNENPPFINIFENAKKIVVSLSIISLILLLVTYLYKESQKEYIIIEPFEVPDYLLQKGWNGKVIAQNINDGINNINESSYLDSYTISSNNFRRKSLTVNYNSTELDFQNIKKKENIPDVQFVKKEDENNVVLEVGGANFSLNFFKKELQKLFNVKTTVITGELVILDSNVVANIRINGNSKKSFNSRNIDSLCKSISEYSSLYVHPLGLAKYLVNNQRFEESYEAIQFSLNNDKKNEFYSYCMWGIMEIHKKNYQNAAALCKKAVYLKPSDPIGYNNLGTLYMFNNNLDSAGIWLKQGVNLSYNENCFINYANYLDRTYRTTEAIPFLEKILEEDSYSVELYKTLAVLCGNAGLDEKADKYYKKVIDLNPYDIEAYNYWGNYFLINNNNKESLEKFLISESLDPLNLDTHENLFHYYALNNLDSMMLLEASKVYKISKSQGYIFFGEYYISKRSLDTAQNYFQQALLIDKNNVQAYIGLGNVLRAMNKFEESFEIFKTAIACEPKHPSAYLFYGYALDQTNRVNDAVSNFKKFRELGNKDFNPYTSLGDSSRQYDDSKTSIEFYRKALLLDSSDARIFNNLGVALLESYYYENPDPQTLNESIFFLNKSLRYSKKLEATTIANYGFALYLNKQYADGWFKIAEALSIDQNNIYSLYYRGKIYDDEGKNDSANYYYEKVIHSISEHNEPKARYIYNYAVFLMKIQNYSKAETILLDAIAEKPTEFYLFYQLAKTYELNKNIFKAIETYKKALQYSGEITDQEKVKLKIKELEDK